MALPAGPPPTSDDVHPLGSVPPLVEPPPVGSLLVVPLVMETDENLAVALALESWLVTASPT